MYDRTIDARTGRVIAVREWTADEVSAERAKAEQRERDDAARESRRAEALADMPIEGATIASVLAEINKLKAYLRGE